MRCTNLRRVGFKHDGVTIAWSQKNASSEYPFFDLPCGKCISCRLNYASEWSTRCFHESLSHSQNIFATLTYSDENLRPDGRLHYPDIQDFLKRLRENTGLKISYVAAGEYGTKTKRPHWHLLIFGYWPANSKKLRTTPKGHTVWYSDELAGKLKANPDSLWPHGKGEFGLVTRDSATYTFKYALKDLEHGHDGDHAFKSFVKRSTRPALGRSWIEKNYMYVINNGFCVTADSKSVPVPRYYKKWIEKHLSTDLKMKWLLKQAELQLEQEKKQSDEDIAYHTESMSRTGWILTKIESFKNYLKAINPKGRIYEHENCTRLHGPEDICESTKCPHRAIHI